jgi:lipoprotein NlpI
MPYNNRGVVYLAEEYIDDALKEFDIAIKLDKKNNAAYLNRSVAYSIKGNFDLALHCPGPCSVRAWRAGVLTAVILP